MSLINFIYFKVRFSDSVSLVDTSGRHRLLCESLLCSVVENVDVSSAANSICLILACCDDGIQHHFMLCS